PRQQQHRGAAGADREQQPQMVQRTYCGQSPGHQRGGGDQLGGDEGAGRGHAGQGGGDGEDQEEGEGEGAGALGDGVHAPARRRRRVSKRQTVAAVWTLSDAACPARGIRTRSGAAASVSSSSPCASFPKSQAIRAGSSTSKSSESAYPLVAAAVIEAASSRARTSSISAPARTGRWNRLPAEARTALGERGSALVRVSSTRSAPAASAVRRRVPTLPGSRTSWSTTTVAGPAGGSAASASATADGSSGGSVPTATTPCGVTRVPWAADAGRSPAASPAAVSRTSARRICSSTVRRGTSARRARVTSSGCSPAAGSVRNTSSAWSGRRASSERTACGPSMRKRPCLRRAERPASAATFRTRSERAEVSGDWSGRSVIAGRAAMSGCRGVDVLGEGVLGDLDEGGERRGVVHGELGEHATVHLDTREA